uniref:procollagen-proline 4-dioxygenase n=1 Tax=Cacopsylla melanoneura TaxID=428564 RepID=A0A8D8VM01_9HEMI
MRPISSTLLYLVLLISPTLGDYYSSLLNVERLFEAEDMIVKSIEDYIEASETLLDQCEEALDIWETNHKRDAADPTEFVKVPTNGFKLVKRNTVDLDLMVERFLQPVLKDFLNSTATLDKLPTESDLYETTWAVAKLSYVYDIPLETFLLGGELGYGDDYVTYEPVRGDEMVIFLQQLYSNQFNIDNFFNGDFYNHILDGIKDVLPLSGRKRSTAIDYFLRMTNFLRDQVNPFMLKKIVEEVILILGADERLLKAEAKILDRTYEIEHQNTTKAEKFQQLCRGEVERSVKLLSKLKCYYQHNSRSYFLLIAPVKVEQLNLEPEILLFHDILTERQMETVKKNAAPGMERSKILVETTEGSDTEVSPLRLTHQSKLGIDSEYVNNISQLTEDITGLDRTGFEPFSVNIYGVGGYYLYHLDSSELSDKARSATMLFYLSDVQLGGATVFPFFNLTVPPRKGSAIFWYNLHTSGNTDFRMAHASCPVLLGYKWIATYWVLHQHQTFRFPCIPNDLYTTHDDLYLKEYVVIPELQQQ